MHYSDPEVFSDAEKLLLLLVNILQSGQTVGAGLTLQDQSELIKIEVISWPILSTFLQFQ